jgi:hypothetical protein
LNFDAADFERRRTTIDGTSVVRRRALAAGSPCHQVLCFEEGQEGSSEQRADKSKRKSKRKAVEKSLFFFFFFPSSPSETFDDSISSLGDNDDDGRRKAKHSPSDSLPFFALFRMTS